MDSQSTTIIEPATTSTIQPSSSSVRSQSTPAPPALERRGSSFLSLSPIASDSYPLLRRPSTFLVLSPKASGSSYPVTPLVSPPAVNSTVNPLSLVPEVGNQTVQAPLHRRSSSVSSDGSARPRFLKLGPVHFGGEQGVGDFAEVEE
ncbi:hypothetical protein M501DRAFT_1016509 [Patellaria atrata CBS 101060]|uniref:Uncharacterized protein n=1 Tax=Patellaria atrata CBS 101060 TaxID=1346257 RepID=A0A9P4VQ38_9PEZI|nr:hypothetical protein M501DRAFT_1016509 [Patellaria atrata CBS 101060]